MENLHEKKERRIPVADQELCVNCKKCIEVCPNNAVKAVRKDTCSRCLRYCQIMDVPCKPEKIVFDYKDCNSCGLCVDVCPEHAIFWFVPEKGIGIDNS